LVAQVRVRLGLPTSAGDDWCLGIGDGARLGEDLLLRRGQPSHLGQQGLLGGEALTDEEAWAAYTPSATASG
jgi:hypothetical protein